MSVEEFIKDNIEVFITRLKLVVNNGSLDGYTCDSGFHGLLVHKQTGEIDPDYVSDIQYRPSVYGKNKGKQILLCDACKTYYPEEFVEKIKALNNPKLL